MNFPTLPSFLKPSSPFRTPLASRAPSPGVSSSNSSTGPISDSDEVDIPFDCFARDLQRSETPVQYSETHEGEEPDISKSAEKRSHEISKSPDKKKFWVLGGKSSPSTQKKTFSTIYPMILSSSYLSLFKRLELAIIVPDPKKMYLPPDMAEFQWISREHFTSLIVPPLQTEEGIMQCSEDSKSQKKKKPPNVGEEVSFRELQEESRQRNNPLYVGSSYINNYPTNIFEHGKINHHAYWGGFFLRSNSSLSILADGYLVGPTSEKAAKNAVASSRKILLDSLSQEQNLENVVQTMLMALQEGMKSSPTTSLNICYSFTTPSGDRHILSVGSGDTTCYLCGQKKDSSFCIIDLSQTRRDHYQPIDYTGGLSGTKEDSQETTKPSLSSLSVVCYRLPIDGNFYVFNCSRAVRDNFNPKFLGFVPQQVNTLIAEFIPDLSWEKMLPSLRKRLFTKFETEGFIRQIAKCTFSPDEDIQTICAKITNYCRETTTPLREAFEAGVIPKHKATSIKYLGYPGTLDFTAIIAFKILETCSIISSGTSSSSSSITASGSFSFHDS